MRLAAVVVAMLIACNIPAAAQVPVINGVVSEAALSTPVSPEMPVLVSGTNLAGGIPDPHAGPAALALDSDCNWRAPATGRTL